MTSQLTPGVEQRDVFPPPARSFLTGVPAFLGRAGRGPHTPRPLTLWPQFEATFGAATPGFLADAVRGFFDNDGLLCYVARLDESRLARDALTHALDVLDDFDDIDLVCAPDLVDAAPWPDGADMGEVTGLQRMLLAHCRERGDRFALLDAVPTVRQAVVTEQVGKLTGPDSAAGLDAAFGALYHPWLWVLGDDGQPHLLPPSGHVAGVYSRSDQRAGVHSAPANEVVEGVLDLQVNLTSADVGTRYDQGVNCLRALPGRGIRVWGARTLAPGDSVWRDVTTRRLVGTVSRWLERFMTGLVHEPNDIRLWVRIMREVTAYLDGLFQRGALRGHTPAEAFFVKCDHETNPPEVVEAGMVVTHIGVAPATPAEFITVRVIHGASGVRVDPV